MKGIIYKATCNFDGRVYIGQTIASLKHRKGQHIKDSRNLAEWNAFHVALVQYDYDFTWEVLNEFEGDAEYVIHALNVAEEYHILVHNSTDERFGFNSTQGGYSSDKFAEHIRRKQEGMRLLKGRAFHQYDLEGNYLRTFKSINEIAAFFNLEKIHGKHINTTGQWKGYQWREAFGRKPQMKIGKYEPTTTAIRIAMYGPDGKFIKLYERLKDAQAEIGHQFKIRDDFSSEVILPYAKRDCKLFYRVKDEYPNVVKVTILPAPVKKETSVVILHKYDAYDLDGNFIARYESQKEAALATGMGDGSIRDGCKREEPIRIIPPMKMLWRFGDGEIRPKIDVIPFVKKEKVRVGKDRRVLQYTLSGRYIATYESIMDATDSGADMYYNIRKQCLGGKVRKSNFQWRYYTEDFSKQIAPIRFIEKKTGVPKHGAIGRPRKVLPSAGDSTLF